jgi:hypothetical protein
MVVKCLFLLPLAVFVNRSQVQKEQKDFFIGRDEKDVARNYHRVKNYMTLWCSMMTLCLVFNSVSISSLVLV